MNTIKAIPISEKPATLQVQSGIKVDIEAGARLQKLGQKHRLQQLCYGRKRKGVENDQEYSSTKPS
jgi:hypothetical protein